MPNYDFDYFLNSLRYLDYEDIIYTVDLRLNKPGYKVKKGEVAEFNNKVSALLQWMRTGKRPDGLLLGDFKKFKPLCEILVAKKQMKPSNLDMFQKV